MHTWGLERGRVQEAPTPRWAQSLFAKRMKKAFPLTGGIHFPKSPSRSAFLIFSEPLFPHPRASSCWNRWDLGHLVWVKWWLKSAWVWVMNSSWEYKWTTRKGKQKGRRSQRMEGMAFFADTHGSSLFRSQRKTIYSHGCPIRVESPEQSISSPTFQVLDAQISLFVCLLFSHCIFSFIFSSDFFFPLSLAPFFDYQLQKWAHTIGKGVWRFISPGL